MALRTLSGIVKDSSGNGVYGAKLFISDNTGKKLYDNNMGAVTDFDGKYTIVLPPELIRSERWLRVLDPTTASKSSAKIKENVNTYDFFDVDKGGMTTSLAEVTITAKRPTAKKKNQWLWIVGGIGVAGLIIFFLNKKKKKK